MILALDTSTAFASAALFDGESLRAETTWETGTSATQQLLPAVEHLLQLAGGRPTQIRGIAVALGPGSFNGLRVALSFGKGLASALAIPIVGFPTPDIAAYPFSSLVLPVCAILKLGRNRLVCTHFQTRYGRWQRISDFRNLTLEALIQETDRTTVFCGEIDRQMAATLQERLGRRALLASAALSARRAGYLAEMAWRRLQEEPEGDDLVSLQPIYLSPPRLGGAGAPVEEKD
ncbi:MAG: tRNA (adenosine(37)-N6)-threonylcarbamoyltransferase complex dimerization subunit type 1 TsaB [Chloroflexia bacterium]